MNYYNENDPDAAAILRVLGDEGLIAPGIVDERSIEDVRPDELAGYTQCHFFAGIGIWSLALRASGWPDDRPIWTGSCPCQPFSAAGKGDGFADERHLWPAFYHLIRQCRPAEIRGEQVASKAVDAWIDLVHADLEALGYAFGSVPFPSAGVGAPHIRDRNYWAGRLANTNDTGPEGWHGMFERSDQCFAGAHGIAFRLGDTDQIRRHWGGNTASQGGTGIRRLHAAGYANPSRVAPDGCYPEEWGPSDARRLTCACGNADPSHWMGNPGQNHDASEACSTSGRQSQADRSADITGGSGVSSGSVDNSIGIGRNAWRNLDAGYVGQQLDPAGELQSSRPGPTNGLWAAADWLLCRDGRWRPVEPGTFPLAPTGTFRNRVAALRGAGNAINFAAAQAFCEAVMESA